MKTTATDFKKTSKISASDEGLRDKIRKATDTSLRKRQETVEEIQDWEELRQTAHDIRRTVVDNFDAYIAQFAQSARSRGMNVHLASTHERANKIILDIIRRNSAPSVVKSKSMIAEELRLGAILEEMGVEVVETDLGEFIIQLAGETPSHITAPAIHKSRHDIGVLFHKHLNIPYTDDPEELTRIVRIRLREKFLTARVGITGVNFACADTASLALIENEANIRLCTVLPDIHIAVMSIDKLIPSIADLPLFLKLLTRSASGQRITSYVSIINGPRSEQNPDGPAQLHIILLDGGRRELARHPTLKEALYCIRCGACINICPVYQTVGGHAYGSVYPGPIGSVTTPALFDMRSGKELPFASSLCGACTVICPVKIDLHHHLLVERHEIVKRGYKSFVEKIGMAIWRWMMLDAERVETIGRFARFWRVILGRLFYVPGWMPHRTFPPFPKKSFRTIMRQSKK